MLTLTLAELERLARDTNPALAALLQQINDLPHTNNPSKVVRVDPALLNAPSLRVSPNPQPM